MTTKKRTLVEIKHDDLEFIKTVQEALGCPLAQAVSFVIQKSQPYLTTKIQPLLNNDPTNS